MKTVRSKRRRKLAVEQLESRRLLATIEFVNGNGGAWDFADNWDLKRVPAAGDDVVIPEFAGDRTIRYRGPDVAIKSLRSHEDIVMSSGKLTFESIQQLSGVFRLEGGTLTGGIFSSGTLAVGASSSATVNALRIASDARLNIEKFATVTLPAWGVVQLDGQGVFETGSKFIFDAKSNPQQPQILVNGTLVADQVLFTTENGNNHQSGRIVVSSGARLTSRSSVFRSPLVEFKPGALIGPTDIADNTFDSQILVSASSIKMLSANTGGSNNRSFREVFISGDSFDTGTLSLGRIGTVTSQNLKFCFLGETTIGRNARLDVDSGVYVRIVNSAILRVNGEANFAQDSKLDFYAGLTTSRPQLVIKGTFRATGLSFLEGNYPAKSIMSVESTGVVEARNSTFASVTPVLDLGSTFKIRTDDESTTDLGSGADNVIAEVDEIVLENNSIAQIRQPLLIDVNTIFYVSSTSVFSSARNIEIASLSPNTFRSPGKFRLNGNGSVAKPQEVEVLSHDLGNKLEGFASSNFALGTLEAVSGYVKLVDRYNNALGTGAEAVYVDALVVGKDATLDLNGIKVYARSVSIGANGQIKGQVIEFADGGPLILGQPTPGKISAIGEQDEWTFSARKGGRVSIELNPGSSKQPAPIAPQLGFARVQIFSPNGQLVSSAEGTVVGAMAVINDLTLPSDGVYTLRVSATPGSPDSTGNYMLTARDTNLNPRDPAVEVASNQPAGIAYGQTVRFTASVRSLAATGPNPSGAVQFFVDEVAISNPVQLDSNQQATLELPKLQVGSRRVKAVYSGDTNFDSKTSQVISQRVEPQSLILRADNKSKVAGDPIPPLTYSVSGFVSGESASVLSGQPLLSTSPESTNKAGSFAINIQLGTLRSDNYVFQFSPGSLLVTPAAASVLSPIGGTPQATKAGRAFAGPLQARLEDQFGNPIGQAALTFTAPASGPSADFSTGQRQETILTDAQGRATTSALTANSQSGPFVVVASFAGLNASFQLTNNEQGAPLELSFNTPSLAEGGGKVSATLVRNTPTNLPLTIDLAASRTDTVNLPQTLTFPANVDRVQFEVIAIDNTVADGDRLLAISAASPADTVTASLLIVDDEVPQLNLLIEPLTISEAAAVATATVTRNTPATEPLIVQLVSSERDQLSFPESITIAAGAQSATFQVTAVDNLLATGTRVAKIEARAIGLAPQTRQLELTDDEIPQLTLLTESSTLSETQASVQLVLARNTPADRELTVALSSSLPRLIVPASVMIPIGSSFVSFEAVVIDDFLAAGDQVSTLTGRASGFADASLAVTVVDNEVPTLTLVSQTTRVREDVGRLQWTISHNLASNPGLDVQFDASPSGQFQIQPVRFSGDSSSITFEANLIDDSLLNGTRSASIVARLGELTSNPLQIEILDHETLNLSFADPVISEANGATLVTVTRSNTDISTALAISILVGDRNQLSAPSTVEIKAGEQSIQFEVRATDDRLLNGDRVISLSAEADGYLSTTQNLEISDFEELNFSIDSNSITEAGGTTLATISRADIASLAPLTVFLDNPNSSKISLPGVIQFDAGEVSKSFTIAAIDNFLFDGTQQLELFARADGFVGASTRLEVIDEDSLTPWSNPANALDVNEDGLISPIDVLLIINYLNRNGGGPLGAIRTAEFLDTNADNVGSAIDVLTVINYLNSHSSGAGEGEGTRLERVGEADFVRGNNFALPLDDLTKRRRYAAVDQIFGSDALIIL